MGRKVTRQDTTEARKQKLSKTTDTIAEAISEMMQDVSLSGRDVYKRQILVCGKV